MSSLHLDSNALLDRLGLSLANCMSGTRRIAYLFSCIVCFELTPASLWCYSLLFSCVSGLAVACLRVSIAVAYFAEGVHPHGNTNAHLLCKKWARLLGSTNAHRIVGCCYFSHLTVRSRGAQPLANTNCVHFMCVRVSLKVASFSHTNHTCTTTRQNPPNPNSLLQLSGIGMTARRNMVYVSVVLQRFCQVCL